jgi:Phage tail tube protein
MTTMNTQLGVVDESTYGTPVTVTRFFEYNTFGVKLEQGRVESVGMRPSGRTQRSDRFEPYRIGASGPVVFDVPTKGFGFFLKHMLGTVGTTGPTDSNYVHTGTEGSLLSDFFTMQVNKPLHPAGTTQAHTYHGCKITKWELGCDVDGVLMCTLDIDAEDEDTTTGLASASYPTDYRIFSFAGASLTIAAGATEVTNFKVSCDNGLKTDRRYMRTSSLKKEPTENAMRKYEWSCTVDHSALTNYNYFRDAARANTVAAIVATFNGPIAHGGATLPKVIVTIPVARFDEVEFDIAGPDGLVDAISGVALWDGTNSPVSIAYTTTDVTP